MRLVLQLLESGGGDRSASSSSATAMRLSDDDGGGVVMKSRGSSNSLAAVRAALPVDGCMYVRVWSRGGEGARPTRSISNKCPKDKGVGTAVGAVGVIADPPQRAARKPYEK